MGLLAPPGGLMTEPVQLAKSAREQLAGALNALQSNAHVPDELMAVAEPIAEAMGILHRVERSNGVELDGRSEALGHVRAALDQLQKVTAHHPAVDTVMEAVATSLSKVHALARYIPAASQGAPKAAPPVPASPVVPIGQPKAPAAPPAAPQARPPTPAPAAPPAPIDVPPPPDFVFAAPASAAAPSQASSSARGGTVPIANPLGAFPSPSAPSAAPAPKPPSPATPIGTPFTAVPVAHPAAAPAPSSTQPMAHAQPPSSHHQPVHVAPPSQQQPVPHAAPPSHQPSTSAPKAPRKDGAVDVELGTHSASNFYKGLGGNDVIDHGGIFVATYRIPKIGTNVSLRVLLPGDLEFQAVAIVQWTRDASGSSEPGFGARFTQIAQEGRHLVYRYTRNREPMFYDDL
jgi:hypothetical protein